MLDWSTVKPSRSRTAAKAFMAMAILVTTVSAPTSPVFAEQAPMLDDPVAKAAALADAAAAKTASENGQRVEVTSARTESSTRWANPNGTFTLETHTMPIRLNRNGEWVPVDTSLVQDNGALRPKAAPAQVALSGGGDKVFASLRNETEYLGVEWSENLPEPQVHGSTATYPNVVPNGDLVVRVLKHGFTHSLILRERPTQPLEIRLRLQLQGLNLTKSTNRHLLLSKAGGGKVITAPAPRMWDATEDRQQPDSPNSVEVKTEIEESEGGQILVLKPDPAFLSDPNVKYPVTVDPTSTLTVDTDTWVATDYPDSQRGSELLQAGSYRNATDKARAYIKFRDINTLDKKTIEAAELKLFNYESTGTCPTGPAGIQVRRITETWDPSAITWGSQPSTVADDAPVNTEAYGCTESPTTVYKLPGWMKWDVTDIVQVWADDYEENFGLQLRSTDESAATNWRRWRSANWVDGGQGAQEPVLTVTFGDTLEEADPGDGELSSAEEPSPDGTVAAGSFGCYVKAYDPFQLYATEQAVHGQGKITSCFGKPTGCWKDVDVERNDGGVWYVVRNGHGKWGSCSTKAFSTRYKCNYHHGFTHYYRVVAYLKVEKGAYYGNLARKISRTKGYWCL